MAISKLNDILGLSMFDNPPIEEKREELINDGVIHFQAPLDLDMIKNLGFYTPTKNGVLFLDYTVSVTDSGYLVQIQDITEHQNTEEKLMQEHDVLETVLESSEGPIFSVDCNYRYTSFNLQHAKVMKNLFDADIEIGGNLLDYHTNPENRENAKLNIDKAFNGEVVNIEACAGDEGHNFRYFSIFHTPVRDSNGKVTGAAVYAHDWTERKKAEEVLKESEEKFSKVFYSSPTAIIISTLEGSIIDVNEHYTSITGYNKDEIIGKNTTEINLYGKEYRDKLLEKLLKEGHIHDMEIEISDKWDKKHILLISTEFIELKGKKHLISLFYDITERKKLEENLKDARDNLEIKVDERTRELQEAYELLGESELKFREIFNKANDMITLNEMEDNFPGKFIEINEVGIKRLGYNREELLNMTPRDIVAPDKRPEMPENAAKLIKNSCNTFEIVHITKNGDRIPVEVNNHLINYKGRKACLAISRDITERKKAEKALQESEEKFYKAFHSNPAAMTLGDAEGRWLDVNESFMKLTGYNRDELIGHTSAELNIINTEKREHYINELQVKGARRDSELEIQTKSGEKRIVLSSSETIELNSELRFITFVYDITDLKQAEKQLKESADEIYDLYNNAPCGYHSLNVNGNFLKVNQTELSWLGYKKEELIGKNFSELLTKESQKAFKKNYRSFLERGYAKDLEYELIRKDGSTFPIILSASTLKDEKGNFLLSRATLFDNTELKKAENDLKETVEELKRSNQELQQFAYVSSHDLQEPLRTITSFTQLLERRYKGQLDSDADEFMEYIVDASIRMKQQIQDLLDYSRVATKGEEFELVDTNDILNQTIKSLSTVIYESDAEITYDELPKVRGDAGQLQRVFLNLISNAIKFRKCDEPLKIDISAYKSEDEKEYVFSVSDNGIGIEEQYFERIFTIFQRLHTRDIYKGTGIGLSIVKRIIERHGGHIWVGIRLWCWFYVLFYYSYGLIIFFGINFDSRLSHCF